MSLTRFKLPGTDTRLIKHGDNVFKFKIHYESENSRLPCTDEAAQKEIEQVIRVVFKSPDGLQPMKTDNFTVFPYKHQWKTANQLEFLKNGKKLNVAPEVFNIYLVDNELSSERRDEDDETVPQDNPIPPVSVTDLQVDTSTVKKTGHSKATTRKHSPVSQDKSGSQRRTTTKPKQYALRRKLPRSEDSEDAPSGKRPTRRLRSSARIEDKRAKQTDRSPEVGTEAEGSMPADPEGGIELSSRCPDRDIIQQNQLEELMRLQNLARPSGQNTDDTRQEPVHEQRGVLQTVWNAVMTPAKKLLRGNE